MPISHIAFFPLFTALLFMSASWGWSANNPDLLTAEERRWVEAHNNEFTLAPTPDSPPVEFYDSQGRHQGIAADMMRRIGERLGIHFKLVRFQTWDEIVEAGRQHKIDLTSFAQSTLERKSFWNFTTPYLDVSTVMITSNRIAGRLRLDDLAHYKTGIVKNYALNEILARNRPGLRLIPMPDDKAGLTALETGELDVMIADLPTASYLIQRESMIGLHVAGDTGYQYHYSIASRSDWPELGRILQKGLDSITAQERAAIYHRWVTLDNRDTRYWKHFAQVLTALLTVLGLGLIWMRILRAREARRRAEMSHLLEEQRRVEQALRESEQYNKLLFNSSRLAMVVMDPQTRRTIDCNPAAVAIYGFQSREEVLGKTVADVSAPEQPDGASSRVKVGEILAQIHQGGDLMFEWLHQRPSGERWIAEVHMMSFVSKDRELLQFSVRDITARRQAEEALRTLTADLERRVSARTADLEQTNASLHEEICRHEQTQARLRDREARFKAIMAQSPMAMLLFDPEGTMIDANEAWAQMWQADRTAFIGRYNILQTPKETILHECVARALQGEVADIAEHYCDPAPWGLPGQGCWVTGKAYPLRNAEGEISSIILVLEDSTARIEANRALAESESRFRAFFDLAPYSCAINDGEGRYLMVNTTFLENHGLSAEEVLGRTHAELGIKIDPADQARIMETLQQQDILMNYEMNVTSPAGAHRHILCSSRRIELGNKPLIISAAVDITERKRQEEWLRQRESQLRALHETVVNLMMGGRLFQDDPMVAIREIVEIGSSLLGIERVSVWRYENNFAELCCLDAYSRREGRHESGERLKSAYFGSYAAAHQKGRIIIAEDVFTDPQTHEIPASYYRKYDICSLLDAPFWIMDQIGGVLSFEAVGERRKWSGEDERVATILATLISLCIENADRKRAEQALQEADQRKDEFLMMLAHELRNPLAPIRNASHVLSLLLPDDARILRQRDIINRQLTHMSRLVDDLLDVARITRGMIQMRCECLDLRALTDQAIETCQSFFLQREADLVFTRPDQSIWIDADPARLIQVICNLLSNAAKFSEPGQQVSLEIGTQPVNGADEAFIRVRDAGAGIEPKLLRHIFGLFVQGDKTLARSKGGLGIGLTLVQRIAQLHGGRIEACSPGPGLGSEFTFWLPVAPAPVSAGNTPAVSNNLPQA